MYEGLTHTVRWRNTCLCFIELNALEDMRSTLVNSTPLCEQNWISNVGKNCRKVACTVVNLSGSQLCSATEFSQILLCNQLPTSVHFLFEVWTTCFEYVVAFCCFRFCTFVVELSSKRTEAYHLVFRITCTWYCIVDLVLNSPFPHCPSFSYLLAFFPCLYVVLLRGVLCVDLLIVISLYPSRL